jgi:hypothetical protein
MSIATGTRNADKFANWPKGPDFIETWEDWTDEYAAGPVTGTSPWIVTLLASGTSTTSTDAQGGKIILAGTTTDNSGAQVQRDVSVFNFALGTQIRFVADGTVSVQYDTEIFLGLAKTDTTLLDGTGTLAGGFTCSDGIGFYHPDNGASGASLMYGIAMFGSVQVATGGFTVDLTTNHVYSFEVRMDPATAAKGWIDFYVDGSIVGTLYSEAFTASTTFFSESLSITTGTNVAHTFTNDYVGCRQWRA